MTRGYGYDSDDYDFHKASALTPPAEPKKKPVWIQHTIKVVLASILLASAVLTVVCVRSSIIADHNEARRDFRSLCDKLGGEVTDMTDYHDTWYCIKDQKIVREG
jgi:hypothetical protein